MGRMRGFAVILALACSATTASCGSEWVEVETRGLIAGDEPTAFAIVEIRYEAKPRETGDGDAWLYDPGGTRNHRRRYVRFDGNGEHVSRTSWLGLGRVVETVFIADDSSFVVLHRVPSPGAGHVLSTIDLAIGDIAAEMPVALPLEWRAMNGRILEQAGRTLRWLEPRTLQPLAAAALPEGARARSVTPWRAQNAAYLEADRYQLESDAASWLFRADGRLVEVPRLDRYCEVPARAKVFFVYDGQQLVTENRDGTTRRYGTLSADGQTLTVESVPIELMTDEEATALGGFERPAGQGPGCLEPLAPYL